MDELSIAERYRRLMGGSDGVSFRSKRALIEAGELVPEVKAIPEQNYGVGGPSPSAELKARVEAERKRKGEESFQRMMEQRRRGGR